MKKKIPIKAVSVIMAASMMLSFAACNKKGGGSGSGGSSSGIGGTDQKSRSGQKITADTPWYDSKILNIDTGIDKSKPVEYTSSSLAGTDDEKIVVLTTGYYKMPSLSDDEWEKFDFSAYAIDKITVVDRNTNKTINDIDLKDILDSNDYVENATYTDGKINVKISSYNEKTYEQVIKNLTIDPDTGKVTDTKETDSSESNIERVFTVGDYQVETEMVWDNESWYKLYIVSPDGSRKTIELKENGKDYYDIPVVLGNGDNKALVPMSVNGGYIFFDLDLKEGKATLADDKDYSWLNLDMCYSPFTGSDGYVYFTSPVGISKIDFEKKKMELVFDYSWCGVNRSILTYLEIAEMTEDKFILSGEQYKNSSYASDDDSEFFIIEFTKAATNPHAGKTILELYSPYGYTQDKIADAILKFNDTNSEYFIEVSDRYYTSDDTDYSNVESQDDYEDINLKSDAKLSNQLSMDILNGEGPDILMNVSSYGQLNSDNYLKDLTPYIGTLSSDKYFTNVIDAAKADGKLYNLPICFTVRGIHTDAKYAGASGVGFTTDEYEEFLQKTLNGKDVIPSGQAYYFAELFNAMSDKFIVNGKVDFSSPEFEKLAEFVKDNVREKAQSWNEYDDAVTDASYGVGLAVKGDRGLEYEGPAIYSDCYGMSTYLTETVQLQGGTAILGLPSADGRGPILEPYISVAISAQANNADACGEFVKLLLSDDLQLDFAMRDNFVISREAFREAGKAAVEYYNGDGLERYFGYDDAQKNHYKFSDTDIDNMENIILSCSKMNSKDSAINIILIEEMPAYFSGQKDLKSVVAIAQDRVQKVIDERG